MIPGKLYKIHGGGDYNSGVSKLGLYDSKSKYTLIETGAVMMLISFEKIEKCDSPHSVSGNSLDGVDFWEVTLLLKDRLVSYTSSGPKKFLKDFTRVSA